MAVRNSSARRERVRERARRDILLASAEVFARRGYAAATLSDLAEAAGYAPPSLYRYFESKEAIFTSLVGLFVDEFTATFEEPVDPALPLGARLETLLRAQVRLAAAHQPLFGVLSCGTGDAPEGAGGRRLGDPGSAVAFYEERFLAWLRRHAGRSELRHPPQVVARVFAGIAYAFHVRGRADADPERTIPLIVDLALHGFAGDAAAPAGRRGATP